MLFRIDRSLHQGFPLLLLSYHYTTHIHNMTTHSTSSSIALTEANPPSKQSPQVKDADAEAPVQEPSPDIAPAPQLSWVRKHILLALFAMVSMYLRSSNELSSPEQSTFVDICNISGARMAVSPITHDLDLPPYQGVWLINAYALAFAAFLLVAGRLADTFQVRILFILSLVGLGALCLVTSFITNKYAFFVIRGISGLFGALIIPSA